MQEKLMQKRHVLLLFVAAVFAVALVACQGTFATADTAAVQDGAIAQGPGDDNDLFEDADEPGDIDVTDEPEGAPGDDADQPNRLNLALGAIDTNNDGQIGQAELDTFLNQAGVNADQLNLDLSTLDTNGDGRIGQAELNAFLNQAGAAIAVQLSQLDTNNDGQIDQSELALILQQAGLQGQGDDNDLFEDADEPGDVDVTDEPEGSAGDDTDQPNRLSLDLSALDTNNDGQIGQAELDAFLNQAGVDANQFNFALSAIDTNGDGQLGQAEIDAFLTQAGPVIQAQLAQFDTNNDGQIDQNELAVFLQQFGLQGNDNDSVEDQDEPGDVDMTDEPEGAAGDDTDQPGSNLDLSAIDANGDGQLSQAELNAFLTQAGPAIQAQLAQFDTNNDGLLSQSELTAFLQHVQQMGLQGNDNDLDDNDLIEDQDEPGDVDVTDEPEGALEDDDDGLPGYSSYPTVSVSATDFMELRDSSLIYAPSTQPELFVDCVDNLYYPLIPGTVYHMEEQTDEGLQTVTITVTDQTKEIMGIQATVIHDVVSVDGNVTEDTWDWYAQDDRGNVWYLGEDTQTLENGEVTSTAGSWEAGVDGAMPGILMLGHPRPGDIYYQEYYHTDPFDQGAEDMGAVASLSEPVSVEYGSFDNAIQTSAYNPIDDELENKWYAAGVGVVREVVVGSDETVQLVDVSHAPDQIDLNSGCGRNGGVAFVGTIPVRGNVQTANLDQLAQISAQEAVDAAQTVTNARPGNAQLAVIQGFLVYVVPVRGSGVAVVDAGDGVVLATVMMPASNGNN